MPVTRFPVRSPHWRPNPRGRGPHSLAAGEGGGPAVLKRAEPPSLTFLPVSFADVDECALNGTVCGPHGFCENAVGSFRCLCDRGFQESPDGLGCVGE